MSDLQDFYYDYNNNFYYYKMGWGGNDGPPFKLLRASARAHFNDINLPHGPKTYQKTVNELRTMALIEREKENALLNKIYVKEGGHLDIEKLSNSDLIKMMTDSMSLRGMWTYTSQAIRSGKGEALKNNMARMEKHLVQDIFHKMLIDLKEPLTEALVSHMRRLQDGVDAKALQADLENVITPVILKSIDKLVDDMDKFADKNPELEGYKDIKRAKEQYKNLYDDWKKRVARGMFVHIGFISALEELDKQGKYKTRGKHFTRKYLDIIEKRVKNTRNAAIVAGYINEDSNNLSAALSSIVSEQITDSMRTESFTLSNRYTVDNIRKITFGDKWIGTNLVDIEINAIKDLELPKDEGRKAMEQALKNIEDGLRDQQEIINNTFLVKENSKAYDLSGSNPFSGGTQKVYSDVLGFIKEGDTSQIFALLANSQPNGLMQGSRPTRNVMGALAKEIGRLMFDDYGYIGKKSDLNVIHILSLNKNVIPLSVFLSGLADAYEAAIEDAKNIKVGRNYASIGSIASIELTFSRKIDTTIKGGYPKWKSQAAIAYDAVNLKLSFYQNFRDIVKGWLPQLGS